MSRNVESLENSPVAVGQFFLFQAFFSLQLSNFVQFSKVAVQYIDQIWTLHRSNDSTLLLQMFAILLS